jgi:hypothetical protein
MFEFKVEEERHFLQALGRALAAESDGKALKRDLAKQLRQVIQPLRAQVLRRLMSIGGSTHSGSGLRESVGRQTRAGVRFSGKNTGVNLVQRSRGMPRNFPMAGRALNREEGWTPTSLGGTKVHQQATPVEWFDEPAQQSTDEARRAVKQALEDMAQRIANRAR